MTELIVSDDFTRANSTTLGTATTGQAWTTLAGGYGISGNEAYPYRPAGMNTYPSYEEAVIDIGVRSYEIHANVHVRRNAITWEGKKVGVTFWYTNANNWARVVFYRDGILQYYWREIQSCIDGVLNTEYSNRISENYTVDLRTIVVSATQAGVEVTAKDEDGVPLFAPFGWTPTDEQLLALAGTFGAQLGTKAGLYTYNTNYTAFLSNETGIDVTGGKERSWSLFHAYGTPVPTVRPPLHVVRNDTLAAGGAWRASMRTKQTSIWLNAPL